MSSVCEYIALDTETTGLSHKNGDRVIEIGAVKFDPLTGEVGDEFHRYVNPGIPIPPAVTKIHGITDEMLADKPSFAEIAEELEEFVKGAHVVIHNAQFDVGFLSAEQKKAKRPKFEELPAAITCSRRLARRVLPPNQSARLDDLCDLFGVDRSARGFHGALIDVKLLARVFPHLERRRLEQEEALNRILPFTLGGALPTSLDELGRAHVQIDQIVKLLEAEKQRIAEIIRPMLNGENYEHRDFTVTFGESIRTNWDKVKKDLLQGVDLEPYQSKSPRMTIKATS